MEFHEDDPSGRPPADPSATTRTVKGLGIARMGTPPRTQSYRGLIQNAAPMSMAGGSGAAGSYDSGLVDPLADDTAGRMSPFQPHIHGEPDDTWTNTPPLTGRTLGGMSSPGQPDSAWERVAKRQHYWQLDDREGDLGTGPERDMDTMSLDSLQMHDEVARGGDGGDGTGEEGGFPSDYDTYKRSLAAGLPPQPPLLPYQPGRRSKPPANVKIGRSSGLAIWLLVMSVYSTVMSAIWLGAAIAQPRWGTTVSSHGAMTLSTANLVTAILAKTIEMSFVTVFVAFIGQVLTRRAMTTREGMTLSEMSMRTWVTQPGSLLANARTLRYAGRTVLGIMTLAATIVVIFYTTASDTMVAPKLQFSKWKDHGLKSYVKASYANSQYIEATCATPISVAMDELAATESCLDVQNAGNSWPDILNFISAWAYTSNASENVAERPQVESMLYDNVTVYGTWIETQYSNVSASYDRWSRIVNNVSLAMPHPGVYTAATNESMNHILQPSDLDGTGSYNVSGSVISPAANVLCVNMAADELAPLVYTQWPHANTTATGVGNQTMATNRTGWTAEVPILSDDEWLNSTAVDDIFGWGAAYGRRPPVFELYPADNNLYANGSMPSGSSVYMVAKSRFLGNYTVCELRSWPAIQCSTRFDASGTTGMSMRADCAQAVDYDPGSDAALDTANPDAYVHHMRANETIADAGDWKYFAAGWVTSLSLSGGQQNSNSSVSRILTECALRAARLNASLPSMAEGLAALLANTLVTSALDTPFVHYWAYDNGTDNVLPGAGALVSFPARVRSQEYASWHSEGWQGLFYLILGAAFVLNFLCLGYLCRVGLVKDFLEPTSLFTIATSVSSAAGASRASMLRGGGGGEGGGDTESMLTTATTIKTMKQQLAVPYRLAYRQDADYYVFEEAAAAGAATDGHRNVTTVGGGAGGAGGEDMASSGVELEEGVGGGGSNKFSKRKRYVRLSANRLF